MLACGRVGSRHDEGACVLRSVGVLDIDRNVRASHREDSVLVEHACAHVGKLAQLGICDNADSLGVLDDTGVSYQEAAYVCPVLVEVCVNRAGYDGASDIRTTAGEGVDRAVRIGTVEARDNGALSVGEAKAK